MAEPAPPRTWVASLIGRPSLIALFITIFSQLALLLIFQIRNNDQQEAEIRSNTTAIRAFESNVTNLQTPLGALVQRIDGRLSVVENAAKSLETKITATELSVATRIESIDKSGPRAMDSIVSTQQRLSQMSDRLAERVLVLDQRLNESQARITLLAEQFNRTDRLVAQMFDYLRLHSSYTPEPPTSEEKK